MSKKGNKRLRRLLYLAITCMLRNKSDNNSIREFYQKDATDIWNEVYGCIICMC